MTPHAWQSCHKQSRKQEDDRRRTRGPRDIPQRPKLKRSNEWHSYKVPQSSAGVADCFGLLVAQLAMTSNAEARERLCRALAFNKRVKDAKFAGAKC